MQNRQLHQPEVEAFLCRHFASASWKMTLPHGKGHETYFARGCERSFFVKLGAQAARYQAAAAMGLTPQVLAAGCLEDGTSIIVQPYIPGKTPSRRDFHTHLEQFASALRLLHNSTEIKHLLPRPASDLFSAAGLEALARLQHKWECYKSLVPQAADFIDESLANLFQQVKDFPGAGLAASHNDICNANWLVSTTGKVYLIDLDSMSLDDPALDFGALLWWYYPPGLRAKFLVAAGHAQDPAFEKRMRVRMTLHCLNIILPREGSFDVFDPASFASRLTDFRASLAGEENPQGYDD